MMSILSFAGEVVAELMRDDMSGEERARRDEGRARQASTPRKRNAERREDAPRKEVIPVFFTIDDGYAPLLGVALSSLIANASQDYDYDIVILHHPLSEKHRAQLEALARPGFNLRFVEMDQQIAGIANQHCNKLRQDYFTLTIFFRLFIPSMFPEYSKGIYLDSDVVVPGDISKMFEVDLGSNFIGACQDSSIVDIPELVAYANDGVGVGIENYINSGVLLMNLDALRAARLDERFLELLDAYHFDNIAPDQDYLNVLCHGRITYLDGAWDAMPVEGKPELEEPMVVHYNLFAKPWCYDNVPYGDLFWCYAFETDFFEEIAARKRAYSDEQKKSDARCLETLVERGAAIAAADFNFRVAFERGGEKRLQGAC